MPSLGPVTFRDHFASIFQSAVTEVGRRMKAREPIRRTRGLSQEAVIDEDEFASVATDLMSRRLSGVPADVGERTTRRRGFSDTTRICASLALRYMEARLSGEVAQIAQVEGEFTAGTCDPAWATTISEYLQYFGPGGQRSEIPYIPLAQAGEGVIPMKRGARIALISDWGTGAEPARQVLRQIHALAPDVLIHLGDVYYSGTPEEYKRAFLNPLEEILRPDRSSVLVYALSGNHDMYCGGEGYYGAIAALNSGPLQQHASFFCLRSEDTSWQLISMDTGLNDYSPFEVAESVTNLRDDEAEWLLRRIAEFGGKTILLSHHQLFSAFSRIGPAATRAASNPHLLQIFGEAARLGEIPAWFWGHEHNLAIYEPYAGLERGRCVGHGAVPVDANESIYSPVEGLMRPPRIKPGTQLDLDGSVYAHGFAILTLGENDAPAQADYYQCRGGKAERLFSEMIG
jgi:hypothetical protein